MAKTDRNWQARIGRRLRLRDLHVLLAVAQSRSMAKAARELSISQPAVSQAIADLEHTLGVRLLDRSPRGIEPTDYGRALLRRSLAVFDELGQAVRDIEFLADPTQGELRLGCPELIVAAFVPVVVERFARQNPRVILKIEQIHDVTPHFRELRDRRVDLVLARTPRSFAADDLRVESLVDERFYVVAGGTSRWLRRRNLTLGESRQRVLGAPASRHTCGLRDGAGVRGERPRGTESGRVHSVDALAVQPHRQRALYRHAAGLGAALQRAALPLEGLAGRIPDGAQSDSGRHLNESDAQPLGPEIHRQHPRCRAVDDEGSLKPRWHRHAALLR